jgi:hypothetical protein
MSLRLAVLALTACLICAAPDGVRAAAAPAASVVVDWNRKAHEIAFAKDQFLTFKGPRAFAMTHIAQHDALNAVFPRFEQFAYFGRDSGRTRSRPPRRQRATCSPRSTRPRAPTSTPSSPSSSPPCRTAAVYVRSPAPGSDRGESRLQPSRPAAGAGSAPAARALLARARRRIR